MKCGRPSHRGRTFFKMKILVGLLLVSCFALGSARAFTEQQIVNQSAKIVHDFREMPDKQIPQRIISNARGLAIIRVLKVGFA